MRRSVIGAAAAGLLLVCAGSGQTDYGNRTEYQYRLCGTEDDSQVVCAQTRRFTTGRDTVQAYCDTDFVGDPLGVPERFRGLDFDVVAGPSGVSGPAFVFYELDAGPHIPTFPLGVAHGAHGPLGSGQDGLAAIVNDLPPDYADRDPSDCSPIQRPLIPLSSGEIVVNEAPPAPG